MEFSKCKNCEEIYDDSVIWNNWGSCPTCGARDWEDV